MNNTSYLDALGADITSLNDEQKSDLDEKGFIIIPNLIDPLWIKQMRIRFDEIFEEEGENAAHEHHKEDGAPRLANLVNKVSYLGKGVVPPLFPFSMSLYLQWWLQGQFPQWTRSHKKRRPPTPPR